MAGCSSQEDKFEEMGALPGSGPAVSGVFGQNVGEEVELEQVIGGSLAECRFKSEWGG